MQEKQALKDIISELNKVKTDNDIEQSSQKIISIIGELVKTSNTDSGLMLILETLYDALAFDDLWSCYSVGQYEQCTRLLERLSKKKEIWYRDYEKTTDKLEKIGFFTTPYPMSEV